MSGTSLFNSLKGTKSPYNLFYLVFFGILGYMLKICKKCGKEFTPSKGLLNFCSLKCTKGRERTPEIREKISKSMVKQWENGDVFKNLDWGKINKSEEKIKSAKKVFTEIFEDKMIKGEYMWITTIKKNLIELHGHECWLCGTSKWPDYNGNLVPVPLIIDHINGINDDNNIENLRIICRNCDGLLDTYCARNIGKHSKEEPEAPRSGA